MIDGVPVDSDALPPILAEESPIDEIMIARLREAWRTNHRITRFVLDKTSDEGLLCTLSKRGGRNVARQFAHLHDVRLSHLERRAKDLSEGLPKFASKDTPSRGDLEDALTVSADRIEEFLVGSLERQPKRTGFKKGIFTTLSYFVAHEAHHRGSILLTLKECGHAIEPNDRMAIWAWDQI